MIDYLVQPRRSGKSKFLESLAYENSYNNKKALYISPFFGGNGVNKLKRHNYIDYRVVKHPSAVEDIVERLGVYDVIIVDELPQDQNTLSSLIGLICRGAREGKEVYIRATLLPTHYNFNSIITCHIKEHFPEYAI